MYLMMMAPLPIGDYDLSSSTTQNKTVAKRYPEEAWGRGNLMLIDELMACLLRWKLIGGRVFLQKKAPDFTIDI
jgi:hypothetical protein